MKVQLLEYLRCPACQARLVVDGGTTPHAGDAHEVLEGVLRCAGCARAFPIRGGIPRMLIASAARRDDTTRRTAATYGYLWEQTTQASASTPSTYHFEKMVAALELPSYIGVILDAGCGEGIDLFNLARRGTGEVIGIELSDGGCETTFNRTAGLPNAHVVQADLRHLPFADGTFDAVYSYGVLHHVPSPPPAAAEVARVARPGAPVSVYLYEDFEERFVGWRWALKAVNQLRAITTALPPRVLYALCQAGSPIMFLLFAVPHRVLRHFRWTRAVAFSLPYRHGTGPFALVGDLYDRFSAPVELRYNRRSAVDLLAGAGMEVVRVAYERGWMVFARTPQK